MADHWFRPKTHFIGAYPLNWKGWAAIAGYFAANMLISTVLMVIPGMTENLGLWLFLVWAALITVLTVGFVWLCKVKTDGPWRWRWGGAIDR